jgi:hypothetical protein
MYPMRCPADMTVLHSPDPDDEELPWWLIVWESSAWVLVGVVVLLGLAWVHVAIVRQAPEFPHGVTEGDP